MNIYSPNVFKDKLEEYKVLNVLTAVYVFYIYILT